MAIFDFKIESSEILLQNGKFSFTDNFHQSQNDILKSVKSNGVTTLTQRARDTRPSL